jgi:hypothetical protein
VTYEEERNSFIPVAQDMATRKVGQVDHNSPLYKQDEWDVAYLRAMQMLWERRGDLVGLVTLAKTGLS